jgi:hypothetical protein
MCKCKRQGEGQGQEQGKMKYREVDAVMNKLERAINKANDQLIAFSDSIPATYKSEAMQITKALFDNMSKDEIVDGILDDDVLSFDNLMEREDVRDAIAKSETIMAEGYSKSAEVNIKFIEADEYINPIMESIVDDVIIFGINDDIRNRIIEFEAELDRIVSEITNL